MSKLLTKIVRRLAGKPVPAEPPPEPPPEPEGIHPDPRHNPVLWGIITGSSNRS